MQETLTNACFSFATESSQKIKPSSHLYSSKRAPMRGLVGVLRWGVCLVCSPKHNKVLNLLRECPNVSDDKR